MINEHTPIDEPIEESSDDNTDRAEWKIQLTMQNSCISTKSFEETWTIYTKSEALEVFMGSNTDVIDKIFNTLLQIFQHAQEISNERGSEFIPDSAELYCHFQRVDIRRAESYTCLQIG